MARPRLRIYFGPEKESTSSFAAPALNHDSVTVPLGEVFEWLSDAIKNNRTWLRDFEDDKITISSDLYEVVLAYQHYRRPSA